MVSFIVAPSFKRDIGSVDYATGEPLFPISTKNSITSLFEIRIKDRANIHRIFYFAYTGRKLVLLHGFTKKTEKTPGRGSDSRKKNGRVSFKEEVIDVITYREHRKELLKDKKVRAEYEKLLPEYELAKSIIEQCRSAKLMSRDGKSRQMRADH